MFSSDVFGGAAVLLMPKHYLHSKISKSSFRQWNSVSKRKLDGCLLALVFVLLGILFIFTHFYLRTEIIGDDDITDILVEARNNNTSTVASFKISGIESSHSFQFEIIGVSPNLQGAKRRSKNSQTCTMKSQLPVIFGPTMVTSSVLFKFNPVIVSHVQDMLPRHVVTDKQFRLYPFQISCIPDTTSGHLVCVARVWLRSERFQPVFWESHNRYQDNYLYVLRLDRNLKYVDKSGHLIGIPSPIHDLKYTGPEDPRVFIVNGSMLINFVQGHLYENVPLLLRQQFLWDVDSSVLYQASVKEVGSSKLKTTEKNWTPWVINNTLHFVYQYSPLTRVLKCNLNALRQASCKFLKPLPNEEAMTQPTTIFLRGGSPVVQYSGDYYLAVTHTWQRAPAFEKKFYASQLCLLHGPSMQLVFASTQIIIDPGLMLSIKTTDPTIIRPFLYTRSIFLENRDSVILAAGVNDNESMLIRLKGIAQLLRQAIKHHQTISHGNNTDALLLCQAQANANLEQWLQTRNEVELRKYFDKNAEEEN